MKTLLEEKTVKADLGESQRSTFVWFRLTKNINLDRYEQIKTSLNLPQGSL